MENNMIISSKMCDVSVIGEPHVVMETDISVVCKDGKYGLIHTSRQDNGKHGYSYEKELILPCEYDNIFFVEIGYATHVIAVHQGKQGLICFDACTNGYFEDVTAEERLPCVYDRIEIGRENDVLFLYNGNNIFCYHLDKGKIFAECEGFKELSNDWLLCISADKFELWNTHFPTFVTTLETDDIAYLGSYERGDVFRLKIWDEKEQKLLQQLLFGSYTGQGFHFGPKAQKLTVHTKRERKEPMVVSIEMAFGNEQDRLSVETMNEITKD